MLDIAHLHEPAFDRTTLNADYKKCMDPQTPAGAPAGLPATVADIISVQLQIARVAAEERAFRSRHGSLVRHMAHAGARRQGLNDSLAIDGLVKQVERILLAGNLAPPPGANV